MGIPPTFDNTVAQDIFLQFLFTDLHQVHRVVVSALVVFHFGVVVFTGFFLHVLFCCLDVFGHEFYEVVGKLLVRMAYLLLS